MPVICKSTLDTCLQTSINAVNTSNTAESILLAAAGLPSANSIANYVSATASLPCLGTWDLEGQLTMVCNVPVFATHKAWVGLDGRTLRQDCFDTALWAVGYAYQGQLGTGNLTSRCSFVQEASSSTDWASISASKGRETSVEGHRHGGIKKDGTLWTWGRNHCGQLGDGTVVSKSSPVREFCSATNWCNIGLGSITSAAIKTDGSLWTWGRNYYGSLGIGLGTSTNRCSPVREFCSATDWSRVKSGCIFSVALKTGGSLWGWGRNSVGQLGTGSTTNACSPVQEITSSTNWCNLDVGTCHTVAVKTDGTLWSWGAGSSGTLGNGLAANRSSPVQEFCSATDWCAVATRDLLGSSALKTDGSLWSWGRNTEGQLGLGTTADSCSPVREICNATNWCTLAGGRCHTGAIKTDGSLWVWGSGYGAQLGTGNSTSVCSPVREFYSASNWCLVSMSCRNTFAIRTS